MTQAVRLVQGLLRQTCTIFFIFFTFQLTVIPHLSVTHPFANESSAKAATTNSPRKKAKKKFKVPSGRPRTQSGQKPFARNVIRVNALDRWASCDTVCERYGRHSSCRFHLRHTPPRCTPLLPRHAPRAHVDAGIGTVDNSMASLGASATSRPVNPRELFSCFAAFVHTV